MPPYSMDFRERVVALHDEGMLTGEIAEMMRCSPSWVRRLMQRRRELGTIAPIQQQHPDQRAYKDEDETKIRRFIQEHPDATLREVAEAMGKPAHVATVCRTLQRLKLPRKKKSTHAAEQDRPDVAEARRVWFDQFADVKVNQLVFLDEFGATTNMARTHGRAPRGQRVVAKVPHGHWKVISTIAAMTTSGILAAASFDGATDTTLFVTFVRQGLVPLLRPGQVVVMDNLAPHKSPMVQELIESAGARLLRLPPYSPDLNPIELAISKIKTVLRTLACRTVDGLFDGIGEALGEIGPTDALHYIAYRGYATSRCKPL